MLFLPEDIGWVTGKIQCRSTYRNWGDGGGHLVNFSFCLTLLWRRSLSYCSTNQWTGFYVIGTHVMKELRKIKVVVILFMLSRFNVMWDVSNEVSELGIACILKTFVAWCGLCGSSKQLWKRIYWKSKAKKSFFIKFEITFMANVPIWGAKT